LDIKIYKSVDNGETWLTLETDDYGRAITTLRLSYDFNRDGLYRVVIEDNFRSGIAAVVYEIDYLKPAPIGTLYGVSHIVADGGKAYTNTAVKFTWTDEAQARLTYGGEIAEYRSGTELAAEGEYRLEFFDTNGYSKIYSFIIDKTAPEGALSADNGGITNKPVTLEFTKEGVIGKLYKDGEFVGEYESGTDIIEDGEYKITLTDRAGNATEYAFIIDTVKPEATLVGVENGGKTGGSVTLKNPNKQAEVTAYRNGEAFDYTLGDTLTQEGSYRIVLTDKAGNVTEYEFDIVYAVNAAGTVVIIIIIGVIVFGAISVKILRKRKAFKPKQKKNDKPAVEAEPEPIDDDTAEV